MTQHTSKLDIFALTLAAAVAVAFTFLAATNALAADKALGVLTSVDAGQPPSLTVSKNALLSVQCTENSLVNVYNSSSTAVTRANAVRVPQNALFTTSATAERIYVSMKPESAVVDAGCIVYERQGNE